MFLLPFLDLTVHHVQQPGSQGFLSCSEKEKYETANWSLREGDEEVNKRIKQ